MSETANRISGIRISLANLLIELDRILRGEATCRRELFRDSPKNADIRFPVGGISVVLGALGGLYGFCMAIFALLRGAEAGTYTQAYLQIFASITKVPLLFVLTLLVTFPSLYVFNALMGSRMSLTAVLRLLIASLAVNLAVLASLGPVAAFFALSSPNYQFIVLLNVLIFAIAGFFGLGFLVQTLKRINLAESENRFPNSDATKKENHQEMSPWYPSKSESPLSSGINSTPGTNRRNVDWVFSCWMVAFGLVGAQMGWILRPFIGAPSLPFQWFRPRNSNFFEAVWNAFFNMFS